MLRDLVNEVQFISVCVVNYLAIITSLPSKLVPWIICPPTYADISVVFVTLLSSSGRKQMGWSSLDLRDRVDLDPRVRTLVESN